MAYAMIISCNGGKLAYLGKRVDGGYRGQAMATHWRRPDWTALFKTARFIDDRAIVEIWASPPSSAQIKRAAAVAAKRAKTDD